MRPTPPMFTGGYGGYKDQAPAAIPAPFWQGIYAGGHIGALWSTIDAADNVVFVSPSVTLLANRSVGITGWFGGAQLGYNFESGSFLWGIESDIGGMDNRGSHSFSLTNPTRLLTVSSTGGWYGDLTGRAGYVYGSALFYAKGGFAFFTGDVTVADLTDGISQNSGTFTGWTIGGGFEYMVSPRWTVKAEYLYFDLNNNNCCFSSTSGRFENTLTMSTVKVGFNFLLHSGVAPLY